MTANRWDALGANRHVPVALPGIVKGLAALLRQTFSWQENAPRFRHRTAPTRASVRVLVAILAITVPSMGVSDEPLPVTPACLTRGEGQTTREALMKIQPTEVELLARLTYAEASSTGFGDDPLVYAGIAWGVMNRVRLSAISARARRDYGSGVAGVIFKPQQFNPAVSLKSAFSREFLCPRDAVRWRLALEAARQALAGVDNPFIQTPWERQQGLSLVVNFYYPQSVQARGPLAPWEESRALRFIGDPSAGGRLPSADRIRFYRLAQPPGDVGRR